MARPLRLEFPGALYHITSRSDGWKDIFLEEGDRHVFLDVFAAVCRRFNWWVHAYCLMTDHYHLLVETPDGNLSKGMRQLNGVYTQRFNGIHNRGGNVFQGRYKAILVHREAYLLELARYVVLNPVRAELVRSARDWRWSSYRATTGEVAPPQWLRRDALLAAFADTEEEAVTLYRRFVVKGKRQSSPWEQLKYQIFLGPDGFAEAMQRRFPLGRDLEEIPRAQRRRLANPLEAYEKEWPTRNAAIAAAYASGDYTMKDIGDYFGLHFSHVSRIVQLAENAKLTT